jgi:hypothetical protein
MPSRSTNAPKSVILNLGQNFATGFATRLFDEFAAGDHNIFTLKINLKDTEFVGFAQVFFRITNWNHIQLRAWQEGIHADIDDESAFNNVFNGTFNEATFFAFIDHIVPCTLLYGAALAENNHAVFVLELFEEYFDLLADGVLFQVSKFLNRDDAFGFVSNVDEYIAIVNLEYLSGYDGAFGEILKGFIVHCFHGCGIHTHVCVSC